MDGQVETIEDLERDVRRDWARGLLVGQACAEALAVPALAGGRRHDRRFPSERRGRRASGAMRYGAGTALTLVAAAHVAGLGSRPRIDGDALAMSMAHMWWTNQDRVGFGIDDQRQFQALLSADGPTAPLRADVPRPRIGVSAAVPAGVLALAAPDVVRLAVLANECAAAMNADDVERAGAGVHVCAVASVLAGDRREPVDHDALLGTLGAMADREMAERLSQISLAADADPVVLGSAEGGVLDTVPLALLAFLRFPDDAVACVRFAVDAGGPATTVAALAGALVGARLGESGLPRQWVDRVERLGQLRELADRLTRLDLLQAA